MPKGIITNLSSSWPRISPLRLHDADDVAGAARDEKIAADGVLRELELREHAVADHAGVGPRRIVQRAEETPLIDVVVPHVLEHRLHADDRVLRSLLAELHLAGSPERPASRSSPTGTCA